MSIRKYINLVEALAAVPPTEEPTTTPEEASMDDAADASEVLAPRQRPVLVTR